MEFGNNNSTVDSSAVGTGGLGGKCPPTFLEIAVVALENNAAQEKFSLSCPPPPPRYNFLPTVVDTSKHTKFEVIGFSTFRNMKSQEFPFQNGMSHRDSIFTPWNQTKLEKNHFYA